MAENAYQGLRVVWDLQFPLRVPDRPIHLDALLAWARVREGFDADAEDPLAYQADLPLATAGPDDARVWQASWLAIDAAAPATVIPMVRHMDYQAMAVSPVVDLGRRNRFDTGTGPYKGFDMRMPVQPVQGVTAWAVGDPDRVRQLLSRITHLGKTRRNGWGKVRSVDVVPDTDAERLWAWRTLPYDPEGSRYPWRYAAVQASTEPPYWDRRQWRLAYEPLEEL